MKKPSIALLACAVLALHASSTLALDPDVKCESLKLKFAGKYAFCRLGAESKAVKKNVAPDFTKCDSKFSDKWTKIETKAGAGICPSEGDAGSIAARITADANDLATLLAGGTISECGNAIVDPGEDCDLGDDGGQTCSSLGYLAGGNLVCGAGCVYDESDCSDGKYVFVTSLSYDGDQFGGGVGANSVCQTLADAASLGGTYKAWIAYGSTAPANSFTQSAVPYVRVDGALVANDWADLTDGTLINPISVDQNGTARSGGVWTNVNFNGTQASSSDCSGWSSSASFIPGTIGSASSSSSSWSVTSNNEFCSDSNRLYCFEQ